MARHLRCFGLRVGTSQEIIQRFSRNLEYVDKRDRKISLMPSAEIGEECECKSSDHQ
jgi:hypothetical protein